MANQADPDFEKKGISLTLAKDVSAVEQGRLAVLEYLQPLALDDKVLNRLEVILEELVSNVVRHADTATYLQLSANLCEEGVCICVEDDGAAFNPLVLDNHRPFDDLHSAQLGGLGIPLITRLSKSVEYDRIGDVNRLKTVIAA